MNGVKRRDSSMSQKTILLVDDSAVALMAGKMILRRSGKYNLLEAKDGEEAVEIAVAEQPDLIVMEVVMPKMTGFEVCRALREQEVTQKIPIILVTIRGEAENVEAGYASGCNDYVTKPVNAKELMEKVESLIG